jgi:hypothetical protein
MIFQQNLQALAGIVITYLGRLIGITGATNSYHIRMKRPRSPEPTIQHSPTIILYIDYVVELGLEVVFVALESQ